MTDLAIFLMDVSGGGAERVMLNLARGFAEKGLAIDLVLVKAEGAYMSQLPAQVNIIELKSSRLISSLPALIRYLKQTRPTVLLSALEDTNFIALWARKLAGVSTQVLVTVHNNLSREAENSVQVKRRLTPHLVKLFYPWADQIVAVSQGVADDLIHRGLPAQKVSVIYNPIVTPDLSTKAQEPIEHPWLLPGQPPLILGVGRLTKQKNFALLIQAFAKLRQHHEVRLAILGEGEEQADLQRLTEELGVAEQVSFLGFVENPYAYMAKAAVLVLSSAWEGFGNVLVEAMTVGTPVVSTNCESGPAEILQNGKYGRLVDLENAKAMAEAIAATLNTPPHPEVLQQRANEFTLEKAIEQYIKRLKPVN
jgi:glycosyltransferase involved in cell wall biosynthesis